MTLQTLNYPLIWPGINLAGNAAPSIGSADTLDAAGEYTAVVISAPTDMVISHVGMKCGTATGSPTADVRIETIDVTTGAPTGTLWATNTNIVTATLTTTFTLHALTASATITKGQIFALKVVYASGTSLAVGSHLMANGSRSLPYRVTNTTGSAVKSSLSGLNLALGSSTTAFYAISGLYPASSVAANAFNNTSSARRGVRFQVPFACRASGMRFIPINVLGDYNAIIFDDAGTELSSSSTAMEGDVQVGAVTSMVELFFDNPVNLSPATWYRAVIEPTSATNCDMYTATLPSLNYRSAWPAGTNYHYTTYVASSWTDTATDQVPYIDLMLDQLDDGASVGGGARVIGG